MVACAGRIAAHRICGQAALCFFFLARGSNSQITFAYVTSCGVADSVPLILENSNLLSRCAWKTVTSYHAVRGSGMNYNVHSNGGYYIFSIT